MLSKERNIVKKIVFVLTCFICLFLPCTASAEKTYIENSFRYENGVPIQPESDTSVTLFSTDDYLTGIDVSSHQSTIDWEKVKNAGIDFAIIRCGYGDNFEKYDDTYWKYNADECTRLGIPFGAYLYSYAASTEEAESEAAHALRLLEGYNLSYPVYLDLEDSVVSACSNELIGQMADIFCTTLQNKGYDVGIYANLNWWTNRLTSSVFDNPSWHKWIAQWGSSCTYSGEYTMWQYSSSGSVNGISGYVDMNIWYGETTETDTADYSYPNTYINTGNLRSDILGVAETQIGYTELTAKNGTPVIDSETPYYTKYGEAYGNSNGHWCAFFVLWCAKQSDIPTSIICRSASCGSCKTFVEWFQSNHRWKNSDYSPQYGDIIFFDWDEDSIADHVGIVKDCDGDTIYTIEGNTGGINGYTVMERDRKNYILGYGVPDYDLINKINGFRAEKCTAYMLPDSTSQTVWEIWQNDELIVLCRDEDYYLVLYPFEYTGKFIAAYVPIEAVILNGTVPSADEYYNLSVKGTVNSDTYVYHNASADDIMGSSGNKKIRATLNTGDNVTVLFEDSNFMFIKTDTLTGYIPKEYITVITETLNGDINSDNRTDAGDAGLILRYDAGLISLTSSQITNGDINCDGMTNAGDAGIILRKDAGLIK